MAGQSELAQDIPQGQPQEVIGGGLASGVVRQLQQREELVSQKQKKNEHLLFFNGNGAWARMVSSVNTLTENETNLLARGLLSVEEVIGNKNLAYNNVLMGGTLKQGTKLGGGVNTDKHNPIEVDSSGYIKSGDIKNNAYHNYESLGFRPTPGIESVSVKSKGTYGTLREAEVNFKVWTLEDLEVMQALYLRPGYTVLLEWGHSIQLQSSENVGTLNTQITTCKKFLNNNVDDPMLTFEKELLEITQQSDYNYDAFIGYISNFNWSLNEQGGYDCMVKIIAKGSVLESIACTFDPSFVYPAKQMNSLRKDKGKEERKSIYHKLFTEMQYWVDGGVSYTQTKKANKAKNRAGLPSKGPVMPIYTKEDFNRTSSEHFKKTLNNFAAFRLKDLELKDTGFFDNDDLNEFWIPLHVILDVFNNYVTLIDGTKSKSKGTNSNGRKLTQFYTGNTDEVVSGKYEKKLKYITTDQHFSINPMVCILPKPPRLTVLTDSEGKDIKWPDGQGTSFPMGVVWKNGFHQQVESAFNQGIMRGEADDILNILISVQFLKDELDKIAKANEDSDKNENNNIVYFLKIVLTAMNEAMGGVNDLDVFYDDKDDMFYIVDRKVTPALRYLIPKLNISGTKSVMSNVQISSQISNDIGNMVSIAAQGTGGNSKDNVGPLLEWNAGLLDRHIRHKAQKNTEGNTETTEVAEKRENPEDERLKKWIEDYYDYWREFNGDKIFDNGDFNAELASTLGNYHKKFCQKYVVEAYSKKKDDPKPPPGVVPVELSFTTMGIGGLKIGQAFEIKPGLLPQKYAEDFGYIITGLSHNIQDSKWTTDIKTQFYITKPPTPEEIAAFEQTAKAASEGYRETPASGNVGPVLEEEETPPISGEKVNYDTIKAAVVKKGYKWDSREWAINIVGIRNYNSFSNNRIPLSNKFDDIMTISWIENGVKKAEKFACTTDPGKHWLVNEVNSAGTAILKEGQYINSHEFGTHKKSGGYLALTQINPVTVWRDRNKDNFYDFVNPQTGIFGINIHKANTRESGSTQIDKWSAGCQVVSLPSSLSRILQVAKQATRKIQQNKFTYTLINSRDINI